jgi:hypothetical protein
MEMTMLRVAAAILSTSLVLVACGTPARQVAEAPSPEATSTPRSTAIGGASVRLTTPTDGSTLRAGPIALAADVAGFDVVAKQFRPPVDGEGHVHFYLDVAELPTTHSRPATGDYRSVSRTAYTWPDVEPGEHTFAVQLVGNDHVPLDPPARDEVLVTVAP